MLDKNLELYNAAVNTAPNTDVAGNWVNLGRGGLPSGAQFIIGVDNPGGTAADTPFIKCQLQMTLDNNTSRKLVTEFEFNPSAGYEGQLVRDIAQDFNVQEYAEANVDVRFILSPGGVAANNVTADCLFAFLGYGEKQIWGRKSTADTLYT